MSRAEFTKPTKRAAYERSGGLCEASGPRYGLELGQRCNAPLSKGVIYDHDDPDANSKDNGLDNCRCICGVCNKFKTFRTDIPMIAKTVRQQDKHLDIKSNKRTFPGSRADIWRKPVGGGPAVRRT
jgi:hypothetical protein